MIRNLYAIGGKLFMDNRQTFNQQNNASHVDECNLVCNHFMEIGRKYLGSKILPKGDIPDYVLEELTIGCVSVELELEQQDIIMCYDASEISQGYNLWFMFTKDAVWVVEKHKRSVSKAGKYRYLDLRETEIQRDADGKMKCFKVTYDDSTDLCIDKPKFYNDSVLKKGLCKDYYDRRDLDFNDGERMTGYLHKIGEYAEPLLQLLIELRNYAKEDLLKDELQEIMLKSGVTVTVKDVYQGPCVNRYEVIPDDGVDLSQIMGIDFSQIIGVKRHSILNGHRNVRIDTPIPGNKTIGIEISNNKFETVSLRELLESKEFSECDFEIPVVLGKDCKGQAVIEDLTKISCLLIGGWDDDFLDGWGDFLDIVIMSMLYKNDHDNVKLILAHTSFYCGFADCDLDDLPQLLQPVTTSEGKALDSLRWSVTELESRYQKFDEIGVSNLEEYNAKIMQEKSSDGMSDKLPKIVILVDDLADLMRYSDETEGVILQLAQKGRKAGIHLVLATSEVGVETITGLIKANVSSRIAFSVSNEIESRTLLDMAGAEKLMSEGDMLYCSPGSPKPIRIQSAFASVDEMREMVDSICSMD